MKRWIVYGCAIVLLSSCASLPKPAGKDSALVVGSLVIDFPDGFFNLAANTLDQNVRVTIRDKTEGRSFDVFTRKGGYYYFEAKPRDTYVLVSWETNVTSGVTHYELGPTRIGGQFAAEPGKVLYLGHLIYTYRAPKLTQQTGRSRSYGYNVKVIDKWLPENARAFLSTSKGGTPWLSFYFATARVTQTSS